MTTSLNPTDILFAGLANGFIQGFAGEYGDEVDVVLEESDAGHTFNVTKAN